MKGFLRAGHLPTLLASLLHFETSFMVWVLIGGLGVLISADLGLSPAQKGVLVGIPLLGGAIARIPIGWLGDRYGPKRVGVVTLSFLALPLVCAWTLAPSLPELLLVGVALGVAGSSFAVALPLASRWYPARYQGTALGIVAAGNSGAVLATFLGPRLGEIVGWQAVFGLALIPVLGATLVFAAAARECAPAAPSLPARDWQLLSERDLGWFCFLYSLTFGGYVGFSSFLTIYLHDQHGLPAVAAGSVVAVCAVAGSLMRPIGGALADRVGGIRLLSVVLGLLPFLIAAPAVGAPLQITGVSLGLAMACLGVGNGATFQLVPQRFASQVGLATGVVGAAGGLGGFLLPAMMGILHEATASYNLGFLLYAAALGSGFLCLQALQAGAASPWWSQLPPERPLRAAPTRRAAPQEPLAVFE